MKSLFLIMISFAVTVSYAGEIFKQLPTSTPVNFNQCQKDQTYILSTYKDQLSLQIATLIKGIHHESNQIGQEDKVEAYKAYLVSLIFEKALIHRMLNDIKLADFNKQFGDSATPAQKVSKIFSTNELLFDYEYEISKSLEESRNHYLHDSTIIQFTIHKLEHELIALPIKYLTLGSIKVVKELIKNSIIHQSFSSATLSSIDGTTMIHFGKHVLEGALVGTILTLLTEPLKGSRQSPSNIWFEILDQNPAFMLNPEWMNQLGSPDHPWETHCSTIQKRTELFEKKYNQLISTKKNDFKRKIRSIHEQWDQPTPANDTLMEITPVDNTRVDKAYLGDTQSPIWLLNY